ncbi:uncharacterized protein TM35_000015000 [Trypanosoma theileri]|uniref:Membrane magnesium transporter n=1 Tax=Trypanosoma theileri TaxID=67003 RepID=A0A1X0PAH4_9TRYP|nr:uncharacterized protein TM35_000015000 [Trypanosoma theileri]ORC93623.1 hypothetical protein TM35_000015000 [Trypanosoma theileri]
MTTWHRLLFPLGLLLLAHSLYNAHSLRDQLQEHHHKRNADVTTGGYFPFIFTMADNTAHVNATTIPIFIELLVGIVFAIVGYVKRLSLNHARLIDKNCDECYDSIMYTGVGFMHFNHRGAVKGSQSDDVKNGHSVPLESKKRA